MNTFKKELNQENDHPEQAQRKSDVTKARIVDAAVELFQAHGFEGTTMRAIASQADVSLGNAYYYFGSKEDLMQGYYQKIADVFLTRAHETLPTEGTFAKRLEKVLITWVECAVPHHQLGSALLPVVANPKSSMSPFSVESAPVRDANVALMQEVIDGSKNFKVSNKLKADLPELLWMLQMGMVLFWVYDDSKNQEKTKRLVKKTVPLVDKAIALSRLPLMGKVTDDLLSLVHEFSNKGE